jgi:hypothetical protein
LLDSKFLRERALGNWGNAGIIFMNDYSQSRSDERRIALPNPFKDLP